MQVPVQVTFRHMPVSDAVEDHCWREAAKLERYCDRITACRVTIDEPHRQHQQGNLFQIRIVLVVPGAELVINREPGAHHTSEDIEVALREAFDTARRRLEDHVRQMRGDIKSHNGLPHARVARLFPNEDCGFLQTHDNREIYFHRNSVLHHQFDALLVGSVVAFHEEQGEKGPQASSVTLIERNLPLVEK